MRCLIDIGVQKTGSKSRQAFFRQRLGKTGYETGLYPTSGRAGGWHQPLFHALDKGDDSVLLQLREEASAAEYEYTVVSYEGMHALGEAGIGRIASIFPDLLVVVFVRRQDEFINSMHNQLHKAHRRSLRDVEAFEQRLLHRDSRCDYAAIVQRWAACVGADRVQPIVYSPEECSVKAFLHAGQLPPKTQANPEYRCNRAIDSFGMAVLRQVKAMARNRDELPILVQQAHKDLKPHFLSETYCKIQWTLSVDDRQRIMALYEKSNEWLRARYFNQADKLFPDSRHEISGRHDPNQCRALAEEIVARARPNST